VVPPPSQVGPSEFTRVITRPGFDPRGLTPYNPPPPPPPAPPTAAGPAKTPMFVIVGLIVVGVLAVAMVLYFVLT
jgi:hypothetical protein